MSENNQKVSIMYFGRNPGKRVTTLFAALCKAAEKPGEKLAIPSWVVQRLKALIDEQNYRDYEVFSECGEHYLRFNGKVKNTEEINVEMFGRLEGKAK